MDIPTEPAFRRKARSVKSGAARLRKDASAMPDINNQLIVSYIRDREVSFVQRWIVTADGTRVFAPDALYPEVKKFADPDTIGKRQ